MSHTRGWIGLVAFVVLVTVALDAGGWCVVTVVRTPEVVAVGEPVTVTYAVRQHGQTLLNDLRGRIEARLGATVVHAPAAPLPEKGHYAATLRLPSAGTWTLEIESGFEGSNGQAILRAFESGANVPALSREIHGERLFVSKGCATCHLKSWSDAPRLSPSGYETGYLTRVLTSPPKPTGGEWRMPNLGLTSEEVVSLVAFINQQQRQRLGP